VARTWKCRRCLTAGQSLKLRKCGACQLKRPVRKRPAHMVALLLPYEQYVELNGGEICGICKTAGSGRRRLDRDHDHKTGKPRGLLHPRCNRALPSWITSDWLRRAADYLDRFADRSEENK
jgi:hypothetical protein